MKSNGQIKMMIIRRMADVFIAHFSAGTVFIRQNMTSADVRFWRIKTVPALKELKYL